MKGRDLNGKIINRGQIETYARGGESPHNYGCAVDSTIFTPDGKPVWMHSNSPSWDVYRDAAEKAGLVWGGSWTFKDPGHCELHIECSWRDVFDALRKQGEEGALALIRKKII